MLGIHICTSDSFLGNRNPQMVKASLLVKNNSQKKTRTTFKQKMRKNSIEKFNKFKYMHNKYL